jgi:hypothetical protein
VRDAGQEIVSYEEAHKNEVIYKPVVRVRVRFRVRVIVRTKIRVVVRIRIRVRNRDNDDGDDNTYGDSDDYADDITLTPNPYMLISNLREKRSPSV